MVNTTKIPANPEMVCPAQLAVEVLSDGITCSFESPRTKSEPALPIRVSHLPPFAFSGKTTLRRLRSVPSKTPSSAPNFDSAVSLAETDVVIGREFDPCSPFSPKLQRTMKLLERLAARTPRSITLHTRSPLLLLALPVLKALGERLTVCVSLETIEDSVHYALFPDLPRASERLSTVRALQRFGIQTRIELSPFLYQEGQGSSSLALATAIGALDCPVTLFRPLEILSLSGDTSPGSESLPMTFQPREALSSTSHQLVFCALREVAPERVMLGGKRLGSGEVKANAA